MTIDSFVVDIETLSTHSDAVILSAAIVAVDFSTDFTLSDLLKNTVYVKFKASEQKNRNVLPSTIAWWDKQDQSVKQEQLFEKPTDFSLRDGYTKLMEFVSGYGLKPNDMTVWTRGPIDQVVLAHVAYELGMPELWPHHRTRDVRTYIDAIKSSSDGMGYCTAVPEFPNSAVRSHNPVSDAMRDAWLLRHGV